MGKFLGNCLLIVFSDEYRHRFVQVEFGCAGCKHRFALTYDVTEEGKRQRCGSYTTRKLKDLRSTMQLEQNGRPFRFVDKQFNRMTDSIDAINYNCKDWANEFYLKIT
jgi:hypothetical protein